MYEPYNRTTGRQILRQTLTWTDGQKKDRHNESQRNQEPDGQTEQNTNLLSQFTPVPTNKPPDRQ